CSLGALIRPPLKHILGRKPRPPIAFFQRTHSAAPVANTFAIDLDVGVKYDRLAVSLSGPDEW
ncbi:MAG TPA: hypothetical protein VJ718_07360, partial [Candidatus Binataceae bacterium]|nr:hypothetical protein [Candidatus Binataceae bacterium]